MMIIVSIQLHSQFSFVRMNGLNNMLKFLLHSTAPEKTVLQALHSRGDARCTVLYVLMMVIYSTTGDHIHHTEPKGSD